jgi:predicted nucleic acid-binding protein
VRKFVLDTNCYIDASRDRRAFAALEQFVAWSAPGLYLSSVVAAELRAGARSPSDRKKLENDVLGPFARRGRVVTPSRSAWDALGLTLATLRQTERLQLGHVSRAFALDVLLAYSCREGGMIMVTRNERDMARIREVFVFDYVSPYPDRP